MSSHTPAAKSGQPRKSKGSVVSTTYEFPYMRQASDRTLRQLIYDSRQGKVFGRTPKNWAQLIVFYSIFYTALAALFAICMKGLLSTIDLHEPKWKLGESLIGTNPGLGFRPLPDDVEQGSLIWYDVSNQSQVTYWTNILDRFMEEYSYGSHNQKNCDFDNPPNSDQVCKLDLAKFEDCTSGKAYGYNNSSPCIFLKLNRIYGWEPEYYNDTENLPEDMPTDLQDYIKGLDVKERNQIWVSCRGENPHDLETIGTEIKYFPSRGFPSYFYPYKNTGGYLSPLVAVKFSRPTPNQIINIECRSWAKNINYIGSQRDRQGSVHFELMIDAPQ